MSRSGCKFSDKFEETFPFIKRATGDADSNTNAYCIICRTTFSIRNKGKHDIVQHAKSKKHLQNATESSKVRIDNIFKKKELNSDDLKTTHHEVLQVYHNIRHNHSFRDMDCTSKIISKCFDKKFSCGKTKTRAVVGVLADWSDINTRTNLSGVRHVVISCDASNHKAVKLLPVLVRYCIFKEGAVNIINNVLDIYDLKCETADAICDVVMKTIEKYDLTKKVIGYLADNANVNFGSIARKTDGNVHAMLEKKLKRQIMSIGCGAHIMHNAMSSAANKIIPIDIENIVYKIYQHFSIYTLRTEKLREFCNFIGVQYKKLLYHSKTRWLSLAPCTERILFLFDAIKSYFLSEDNVPLVLYNFFSNNTVEFWLLFMQPQMELFNAAIAKTERSDITAMEVAKTYYNLQKQIESRLKEKFIPFLAKNKLMALEKAGEVKRTAVEAVVQNFYTELLRYMTLWSSRFFNKVEIMSPFLLKVCTYDDFQSALHYIESQYNQEESSPCENSVFDAFCLIQECIKRNEDDWKAKDDDSKPLPLIEKWQIVFKHLEDAEISTTRIKESVELALCLPGTNADGERVFSLIGNYWSDSKSQLSVECLENVMKAKININLTCDTFFDISKDTNLLAKVKSNDKY